MGSIDHVCNGGYPYFIKINLIIIYRKKRDYDCYNEKTV